MRWRFCNRSERRPLPPALLAAATLVLGACASSVGPPAAPVTPEPEAGFLVDPFLGYPLGVSVDERLRLAGAHDELIARRDAAAARAAAGELLRRNPELHPALLLVAQADLASGDFAAALAAGRRLVEEIDDYFAARMLVARAADLAGDLVAAYDGYFDLGERSAAALGRAAELRPRVLEIVENRLGEALRRNRIDEAGREVTRLAKWAPGEPVTLFAARDLAAAVGDKEAQLVALRRLEPAFPEDLALRGERADLELEVGDPSVGLRIFQDLTAAAPQDPELARKLARAKFRWRLTLLPAEVQTLVRQPRLTRGEFAAVVYWLFPQVRYGRSDSGTIATDVLDHRHRTEIVRAVNLGLLEVDPTLHTYRPDEPQTRSAALVALLSLLSRQEPRLACLGPRVKPSALASTEVCRAAARCGLLAEEGECLPLAVLSGPDAFEMSRGALGQLGIE